LDAEDKSNFEDLVKRTNNCQEFRTPEDRAIGQQACRFDQRSLEEGGNYGVGRPTWAYLALNGAVAVVGFVLTSACPICSRFSSVVTGAGSIRKNLLPHWVGELLHQCIVYIA
jgi:hypothetical protein